MELEIKIKNNKIKTNLNIKKNITFKKFKKECIKLFLNNGFCYKKKEDKKYYVLLLGNKVYEFNPKENLKIHIFFKNAYDIIQSFNFDSSFPKDLDQKETEIFLNTYQEYIIEKSKKDAIKDLYHLKNSNYTEEELKEKEKKFRNSWLFKFVPINTLLLILLGTLNFNLPAIFSILLCFFTSYGSLVAYSKFFVNYRQKKYLKALQQDFDAKLHQYEEYQKSMFEQEPKNDIEIDIFVNNIKKELYKLISLISNFHEEQKLHYLQKIEKLSDYYFEQLIQIRKIKSLEEKNKLEAQLYCDMQNYLYSYEIEINKALVLENEIKTLLSKQSQINQMLETVEKDEALLTLDVDQPILDCSKNTGFDKVKKLH